MTTVLTGGDSFTAHIMKGNVAWPNHIKTGSLNGIDTRVINVSEMASDNVLIARNVIKGLEKWGDDIEVIAGGGITTANDIDNYLSIGANHISLGTICFKPWKIKNVIHEFI